MAAEDDDDEPNVCTGGERWEVWAILAALPFIAGYALLARVFKASTKMRGLATLAAFAVGIAAMGLILANSGGGR